MELSIIIISHGHEAMLRDCLASLVPAMRNLDAEIILLDNLPVGGAERLLRPSFPNVTYINNPTPVGLSENMNRTARVAKGNYFLFLNPDTEFRSGSLAGALDYLERHTDAALLSCRLLNADGSFQQNYRRFPTLPVIFGRALGADRWPWQPKFYRSRMMINVNLDRPTPVDWVFGAFMLIRKDNFAAVGGMDPGFLLYYEDVDLCYRLREHGLRTIFYPDLQFIHRHMRTSARRPLGRQWRWHLRSALRILRKHHYMLTPPIEKKAG